MKLNSVEKVLMNGSLPAAVARWPEVSLREHPGRYSCVICGHQTAAPGTGEVGECAGNTERFRHGAHHLWKCPCCLSIHNVDPVDFAELYRDYPLNERRLDSFARGTLAHLLKRLRQAGLAQDASILDYGCGNGLFVEYLQQKGYSRVEGYDPFIERFSQLPAAQFDCVVANDVIEHVADPRQLIAACTKLVRPGGLLYLGTADSGPVDMADLEPHLMRLHQPFHRVIITEPTLHQLAQETGFELLKAYRRSYMDTAMPFSNYRFLDEFSKALGHNMDVALKPAAAKVVLTKPALWFYGCFGYFCPSAYEPAVVLRRPFVPNGI